MMMEGLASEKARNLRILDIIPTIQVFKPLDIEFFELEPIERIANAIELHTRQYAKRPNDVFPCFTRTIWIEPYPEDFSVLSKKSNCDAKACLFTAMFCVS